MWNEGGVRSVDEFILPGDKSITPYRPTPLFVPDAFDTSEFVHDFLKVEVTPIEEEFYDSVRNSEVRRVSPNSFSIPTLDVYDSYIPVFIPYPILIYSSFHPDEVVGVW